MSHSQQNWTGELKARVPTCPVARTTCSQPEGPQNAFARIVEAIPCRRLDKPGPRHTMPSIPPDYRQLKPASHSR